MKIRLNNGTEIGNVELCAENDARNSLLVIVIEQQTPSDTGSVVTAMSAEGALENVEVLSEKQGDDGSSFWETEKTYSGFHLITGFSYNAESRRLTVFVGR